MAFKIKFPKFDATTLLGVASLFVPGLQPYAIAALGAQVVGQALSGGAQQAQPQAPQVIQPAPVAQPEVPKPIEAPTPEPKAPVIAEPTSTMVDKYKIGTKQVNPFKRLPTSNLKINKNIKVTGSTGSLVTGTGGI